MTNEIVKEWPLAWSIDQPDEQAVMRTFVKICGIKDLTMARYAAGAGANAIGLVFYDQSPRVVDIGVAADIVASLPREVETVALFVNQPPEEIARIISTVKPRILQFHGDENALFCAQFGKPYWKAIRVNARTDLLNCQQSFRSAARLLLDCDNSGSNGGLYGGTGEKFDWQLIPPAMKDQIILSGGLNPGNVALAIKTVNPWAVDVSSGVEESKGLKSQSLISEFMKEVSRANV